MVAPIAVVAAACEFPEASTPQALWQGLLHGRRCFRRFPAQRLALADYLRGEDDPDGLAAVEAGLIEGYAFDRERFVVPQSSYLATDLAHWMALDVADRALAGLPAQWDHDPLLKDRMAVIVANTLTGEFSRANLLRYRWPFVERQARAALGTHLAAADAASFLAAFEGLFKAPFPAPDADSLAGGLSNTIAGRIANHFGLRGGAHAVDGACASSLIAVIAACEKLHAGAVDCVLVAAVDLSLDPFELVGFARNGALASDEMLVYDRDSSGFWPGEGCGCLLLASAALVRQRDWPVLGWIRGCGLSSDGQGGLTRPTVAGQLLALGRAWTAAGLDPAAADYFEGHGTGTPTGDPVEIAALAQLVGPRPTRGQAIPVGSIKANIGHTKAAAGMAGLIKALALGAHRIIPASTGCRVVHPVFEGDEVKAALRIASRAELIAHDASVVVGVNSFGFGGVNCHVVLEVPPSYAPAQARARLPAVVEGALPGELIALHAASRGELAAQIGHIEDRAATLSRSQLADLAAVCRPIRPGTPSWRACVVAATPQALQAGCRGLRESIAAQDGAARAIRSRWAWSAPASRPPVLAFMFPGQGLALQPGAQDWCARFGFMAEALARVDTAAAAAGPGTARLQPLLAEISIAALALLERFDLAPDWVLGHSFGELSALFAAGVVDAATLRQLAARRGCLMQDRVEPSAMLAIETDADSARALAARHGLDLACHNAARKHVLAGRSQAIATLAAECAGLAIPTVGLPTDRAFHSRLMGPAGQLFAADLAAVVFGPPRRRMVSTITGAVLCDEAPAELLAAQFTRPVLFAQALAALRASGPVDLMIEVGASASLEALVAAADGAPCVAVSILGPSLEPLLAALGAAWVCGRDIDADALYEGRLIRPYRLDQAPRLLANPCGAGAGESPLRPPAAAPASVPAAAEAGDRGRSAFEQLQATICELAGLPTSRVMAQSRLLADLHLNSIRARHALATAARRLGIASLPFNAADIAQATVGDMALQLEQLRGADAAPAESSAPAPAGIAPWLRRLSQRWMPLGAAADPAAPSAAPRLRLDDSLLPLPAALRQAVAARWDLDGRAGDPTLLILPAMRTRAVAARLLAVTQAVLAERADSGGLLVLQGAQLANAFLRSVAAEHAELRLGVLEYQSLDIEAVSCALREFGRQRRGYAELRCRDGGLETRQMQCDGAAAGRAGWLPGPADVALVSGGARGIGAATAAFIGSRYGCRLALVGRSPVHDGEVAATLARLAAAGTQAIYVQADLADAAAAALALASIERRLGAVTVIVHAAGINRPLAVAQLDITQLEATLAAKLDSLLNLLQPLPPGQLRWLLGFASIIGEIGLAGEAHYALANEWLVETLRELSRERPATRCLPICWSAWRETGMATRLDGVLEGLARADTRALDSAEALDALREILESGVQGEPQIVSGRYGRRPDPRLELPALHAHRFLEWPRVFYPGIELVADAELSTDTDPYLLDHTPYGVSVLPLACAIEAMWSAARCLQGGDAQPLIEDLRIGDAVSIAPGQRLVLRTSALVLTDGSVRTRIRCSTSDQAVDHFSARFSWPAAPAGRSMRVPGDDTVPAARVLYDGLAFHGPRFQRLEAYHHIGALACQARTALGTAPGWYGALMAPRFAGGEPALRDAALHALQVCIPQHLVLPVAAQRIVPGVLHGGTNYLIAARQIAGDGREFSFDVEVSNELGEIVESWSGLRLLRLASDKGDLGLRRDIHPALLEACAGRLLLDTLGDTGWLAGVSRLDGRAAASQQALARALGPSIGLSHRADGAPVAAGHSVSISHCRGLTLALAHPLKRIACDLEALPDDARTDWPLMLGPPRWDFARELADSTKLPLELACLVTWSASECLLKLGRQDWPFEAAAAAALDAPQTGPIVELQGRDLRVAIGLLRLAWPDAPPGHAALAVALSPAGAHAHQPPMPELAPQALAVAPAAT